MFTVNGKYTKALVTIDEVDEATLSQLYEMINHEAFTNPVVLMPDTHCGKGAVVGFTMPMTDKIVPNVIGVDIGCGVSIASIGDKIELSFQDIDDYIREKIPFGQSVNDKSIATKDVLNKLFIDSQKDAILFAQLFEKKFGLKIFHHVPTFSMPWFIKKCKDIGIDDAYAIKSLGTLGGGNHFIELGKNGNGEIFATVHSGSRNLGLKIANYWQKMAGQGVYTKEEIQKEIQKMVAEATTQKEKHALENRITAFKQSVNKKNNDQLAFLEKERAFGYFFDMIFAQRYASLNRSLMLKQIGDIFTLTNNILPIIESVHNFIDFRDFIIRKGAIRAYRGEMLAIPLNMRDGFLICEGKSSEEWNFSAPHGAGRIFSRSKAKEKFDVDEFKKEMSSVFSTSVGVSTLDESPMAYKDSEMIKQAISPTVKIIEQIKPLINLKDNDLCHDREKKIELCT